MMVEFNDCDEKYICNKSTDANGRVINHVFHTECIRRYCRRRIGRDRNTFRCPICREVNHCPPEPRALPPPFPQEVMPTNASAEHPFFPYTNSPFVDAYQEGNERVRTGPMSHFINNDGDDVYTTPIFGLGNVVSLSVIVNHTWDQLNEAGILLEENVTRDNFDNLWVDRDLCQTHTYGHWLINNREDILEIAEERRNLLEEIGRSMEEKIDIMLINEEFAGRRLYIMENTRDLFDGESHEYLGNERDGDIYEICDYIYSVVFTE